MEFRFKRTIGENRGSYIWNSISRQFIEIIRECPYIAICFRFPFSQVAIKGASAMDPHTVCSWIGEARSVCCSCAGSTKYRITELLLKEECDEQEDLCIHFEGCFAFPQEISECYWMIWKNVQWLLRKCTPKDVLFQLQSLIEVIRK